MASEYRRGLTPETIRSSGQMNIDLRQLRYFLAVAEELSFSHAAEKLLITQPALSESIHEIEVELGTDLFARSGRRISLTWPGEVLLDEARRILRITNQAVRLTREAAVGDAGTLRVGVMEDRQPGIVSKALARSRHLLPELRLIIHVLPTAVQLRALAANHLECALLIGPVSAEGISVELLWSEPLVAAVPRGHELVQRPSMLLSALRNEILILPDVAVSPGYHAKLIELCRARGFEPLCSERAFHLETWLGMVGSGFGIALIPASVDTTRHAHVDTVRIVDSDATIQIMAAWREGDASPAVSAFVATLKSSRLISALPSPRSVPDAPESSSGVRPASGQTRDPRQ